MENWENLYADKTVILNKHFTKGREGKSITSVVIHHNAGNLTTEGCYKTWQTREASAHYQVEADGTIGQLVYDADTAWHAGNWARALVSIGIEHANNTFNPTWTVSDATLDNGAHLTAAICKKYGLGLPQWGVNVFTHNNVSDKPTACPGALGDGGAQHDAYISRAQEWYREMTGTTAASTAPATPAPTPAPAAVATKSVGCVDTSVVSVTTVQTRLKALGYYKGDLDDIDGDMTKAAIVAYQSGQQYHPNLASDGKWGEWEEKHFQWVLQLENAMNGWKTAERMGKIKTDGDYGSYAASLVLQIQKDNLTGAYQAAVTALYGAGYTAVADGDPGKVFCHMISIPTHPAL